MNIKTLLNKQININDKYLKGTYFCLLFMTQALLFMFNASGIPREYGLFWFELYIEWLVKNKYAYITFSIILLIWIVCYIFLRKMVSSFIFMEVITFVFGYANKMRYVYTLKYLSIQDLGLLNEVKDVKVDYTKGISFFCILLLIAAVVTLGLIILFEKRFPVSGIRKITWRGFVVSGIIIAGIIFGVRALALKNYYYVSFGLLSEHELGAVLTGLESFFNQHDEEINEEEVKEFVEECKEYILNNPVQMQQEAAEMKSPTIIAIMSEAFWDMDYLSDVVSLSENPMERYHEIAGNCISGEIAVNIYGGQTVVTEFEFLTGINAMNLPGAMFYYEYITEGTETFASYLKELGYDGIAIHPGAGYYYSREEAYPDMGFDIFYDMQSFQNKEYYRTYLSDHALTDEIIYRYEEHMQNSPGKPLFCFSVSIANHVAQLDLGDSEVVKKDTYKDQIAVETQKNISDRIEKELREYVNGLNETVDALERLLEYFENCDEEVVVVFFGDHAPGFAKDLYEKENMDCIYKTPYLIWSNFEMNPVEVKDFNASYLSTVLMDLLHMPPANRYYVNRYFLKNYPMDTKYIKVNSQGTNILKEMNGIRSSDEIAGYIEDSLNMKSVAQFQLESEKKIKFWSIEED